MKISLRILLINFVIVVLIFVSSTIAFYSVTMKIVTSQHSKNLFSSAQDMAYVLQSVFQETNEDFLRFTSPGKLNPSTNIVNSKVDFIIDVKPDSTINPSFFLIKPSLYADVKCNTLSKFIENYPNIILQKYNAQDGRKYYYGRVLNNDLLDNISKSIRADVAVLQNNVPVVTSNSNANQNLLLYIAQASKELSSKQSTEIVRQELSKADFYATYYKPVNLTFINPGLRFVVFSTLPEAAELRENINNLLVIIGFAGISLSLILVLLFTEKIRRQITHLSQAADITRSGNLRHRVSMLTKDELGRLGMAFNNMLDELEKNQLARNEYTELITLINQNPTLNELSETALTKIIKATGLAVGKLFLVENNNIKLLSAYGLQNGLQQDQPTKIDLYQRVLGKGETVEFRFDSDYPKISTGIISLEIKYLMIYPVFYNKDVIAILELAGINEPKTGIKEYLENIRHQLAIGLSNANAFRKLELLVDELKTLNDEYQKQNKQITEQNKTLLELHGQLKDKNEELELQKERAVEAAILKSQFLASMSHELKTPLSSILGLTELVLNERSIRLPEREKLDIVLRNSNRLMDLINNILNFSKLESGKMEIQKENFNLSELIDEVAVQIRPLFGNKAVGFEIINETEPDLSISADRFKITQVLINLLSNAVKFTEEGTVSLKIKMPEGRRLLFEVTDTGIGISQKDLDIIFEEFRQVDGTPRRKYGGTGLGLAISRKYAELLNGTLTCQSEIGKGSAFTFTLPVEQIDEIKLAPREINNAELPAVLVIDDVAAHHDIIEEYLTAKDYNVLKAFSAAEGIEKAASLHPIAVILNVMINDQSAWEVLKALKENVASTKVPVILVAILDELNKGVGLNVYDFMLKPFDKTAFAFSVEKYEKLSGRKIRDIVYVGSDENEISELNNIAAEDNSCEVNYIKDPSTAMKMIPKLQPDLVIIDLMIDEFDAITLVNKLNESIEVQNIPLILTLPGNPTEKEISILNNKIEMVTIQSKNNPIDVLRVIRDRIQFEGGFPSEDTSAFWLDAKPEEPPDEIQVQGSENKKTSLPKVLIVDDDTDTLFTVGEIVRNAGCETALARNGLECLAALQQFSPDLILLDIMMPQMDGFETIRRIRADRSLSDLPVFALTALAMMEEKEIVIRNGFNDLISKPVNPGMLTFKIEKVLFKKTAEVAK